MTIMGSMPVQLVEKQLMLLIIIGNAGVADNDDADLQSSWPLRC